jgi:NodT family efflux transporter outer membrane factor (OMF) lipoprotein
VLNHLYLKHTLIVLVMGATLSACAVGPDFHTPPAPETRTYTASPLAAETVSAPGTGGTVQRFVSGQDIPNQWWTLFHSKSLDSLIRQALADSPTLVAAQAALRQAEENRRAQFGALFPSVDGNFSANRQQFTGASFGQPNSPGSIFTIYNASVSVSYVLDLFGVTRRGLEELQAQVDYQHYLLEGSYLTLTANIVTNTVQEASLRARIRATREIRDAEEQQLNLVERQFQLGGASRSDVLIQQAQLAQTRTTLPPLEKLLAQNRHQLAVLVGKLPGDALVLPEFELEDMSLPEELPVSLPSALVRQRPDIRASRNSSSACASVGSYRKPVPSTDHYRNYGSESTTLNGIFPAYQYQIIGAGLLQPIFRVES